MKRILAFVIASILPMQTFAQETPKVVAADPVWDAIQAVDTENLNDFLWSKRPIVVFADALNDPRFVHQMELLEAQAAELETRDVVVLTDTDPSRASELRTALRPRGFMLVLIGKDGGVKLRKAAPWDVRALSRVIDKMPMRQQEVQDRRNP